MLGKLPIHFVQCNLITPVLVHTGFQVIALNDLCDTTEIFVCVDVGGSPAFLIHREKCFHITVSAVWQTRHKDICWNCFTGIRINYSCSIPGPIDLHDLTRLVIQVHRGISLHHIVIVVLIELRGLIRKFTVIAAGFAVFQPQ